ncbi:hypothetical protein OPQ81_011367 [Rhizoctonia solani]|nr:hypothetical protein OPQ81_011367 [Rhizoctonia solani]
MAPRSRQHLAVKQHAKWGPTLSEYMPNFEERLIESFDKYIAEEETFLEAPSDLIPLNLLETTLAVVLMSTIRNYTKFYKGGIFDYYYGFLCVRHLIRMICIDAMRQCKKFDGFLNGIKPDVPWQEATEALAASTLESMITVLCSENAAVIESLLGIMSTKGHAFVIDGGLSYEDVEFLIHTLWKARKSIILLRLSGLLPGLPAMLFVLSEMTILSKSSIVNRPWLALEDVIFRCYIGDTTNPEREILRQLCVYIESFVLNRYHSIPIDYESADEEDPRIVTEAYSTMLFRWVLDLLGWQSKGPLKGEDLVPHIIKGAMARLTLEIDREWSGPMLEKRRAFTNRYAGEVFGYASLLVINGQIPTLNVQQALVQMLMEYDFHGLAGRVLMLVTRETSEEPPSFDELCTCFRQMNKAFNILPDPSPEQLASIALVWRKVFLNLMYHEQSALSSAPRGLIRDAMEAWDALRPASVGRPPDLFECMNPRCAIRVIYAGPTEARILCERCEKVTYCGLRCQQIHWSLPTSDAHRLKCGRG